MTMINVATSVKKAVKYLRKSTERQEHSLGDQNEKVCTYAEANDIEIITDLSAFGPKFFKDGAFTDDAISGVFADGRAAFKEMIRIAQDKKCPFNTILVWDVKRFSRGDGDEAGYYRYLLKKHGIEVIYTSEGLRGDDADDLILGTKQWLARQESKDTSKDSIRGMLSRITKGLSSSGHPYACYRQIVDKNGNVLQVCKRGEKRRATSEDYTRLAPGDEKELEIVRRIFDSYANKGMGYRLIARMLNKEGIISPRGKKWGVCAIDFILSNQIYLGNLVYNKTTKAKFHTIIRTDKGFEAHYRGKMARVKTERHRDKTQWLIVEKIFEPPIISQELFDKVQRLRVERRTNKSFSGKTTISNFLWSGVTRCVHCGKAMYGMYSKTKYGRNAYYTCQGCEQLGLRKKSVVSGMQLDRYLVNRIKERFFHSDRLRNVINIMKDSLSYQFENPQIAVDKINKGVADIDNRINALLDSIDPRHRDLINQKLDDLKEEKDALLAKKADVSTNNIGIDVDKIIAEILKNAAEFDQVLQHGAPSERKEIIKSYIGQILIDTDIKEAEVGFYPIPKTTLTEPLLLMYVPNLERRPDEYRCPLAADGTAEK